MKHGITLTELAANLTSQRERKRDYVIDTRELRVLTGSDGTEVMLPEIGELTAQQLFHRQLGTDLGLRADLYDRLRGTHAALYDHLVNGLLTRKPVESNGDAVRRMIRTWAGDGDGGKGVARAFL